VGLHLVQAESTGLIETAETNLTGLSWNELGSSLIRARPAELPGKSKLVREGGWG